MLWGRRRTESGVEIGTDVYVFPSSLVFEGELCFRTEAEESKKGFRRRVGTSQMSREGQRTQKIVLVHFHQVP